MSVEHEGIKSSRGVVTRFFGVESGEEDVAGLVALAFFTIQMTHGLSANAADALFFSRFGVESLPEMYMLVGAAASITLLGYAAGLGRVVRQRFYPAMLALSAAVMLLMRVLVAVGSRWVYAVIWVSTNVTVLVTLTLMWNLASDVADARAAKRLYPLFASAGILGGILGNVLTGSLAGAIGTENLLLVVGVLLAVVAMGVRHQTCRRRLTSASRAPRPNASLRVGSRTAMGSPLGRLVSLAMILGAVLFGGVTFRFSVVVAAEFGSESEIASFLGWFSAAATAAAFLVSLVAANRIFSRFGVVVAILLVAITYMWGFLLWLVAFGLVTASIVRFGQWVMTASIGAPATSALFNVFRGEQRGAVIAFVFAIPANVGVVLSGAVLWAGERWFTRGQTFVAFLLVAVAYVTTIWLVRARYRQALVTALSEGSFDDIAAPQQGLRKPLADADVIRVGLVALNDPQPGMRRLGAEMLGRLESSSAVEALCRQLDDPEVQVRLAVVEALGRIGAGARNAQIGSRLGDADPTVRAATVDVLAALAPDYDVERTIHDEDPLVRARTAVLLARRGDVETANGIVQGLVRANDADSRVAGLQAVADIGSVPEGLALADLAKSAREPDVRAAAVRAGESQGLAPPEILKAMGDPDDRVRSAAVFAARAQGLTQELLSLLHQGTIPQQESALIALQTSPEAASTVVDWAVPHVEGAARLRRLRAHIEGLHGPNMAAAEYLTDLLVTREWNLERLVVRALTQFHDPESTELVLRGIRATNREIRAQALEAIEAIGDRRVSRGLLLILEGAPDTAGLDIHDAIEELSRDDDPWVRALAIRCVAEIARHRWRSIVDTAAEDSFSVVREEAIDALGIIGGGMAKTRATLGTLDRVLFLRRVQLFASLEPADLHIIAELATEEIFESGETIYRAGEIGDEMLVVVRGSVRLKKDDDHGPQVVGEYGEYDHVGELSVLRSAPRSADVEAASDDVRVLVIRGSQLRHLLADRPQVAQAMLTSLAERLAVLIEDGTAEFAE